jgi:hypothetical protein
MTDGSTTNSGGSEAPAGHPRTSNGRHSRWTDQILSAFPAEISRLWIAADPDDVLLDEHVLSALSERGFEVLPFEDGIAFRAEYEQRYRAAWDRGEPGPSPALVLHLRRRRTDDLPWDYLRQARRVSLSLADLFPRLSYAVVRQLGAQVLPALFDAQAKHLQQPLGETATKEFVLTHLFRLSPHVITRPVDLWRELLRLHHREMELPPVLADHVGQVVGEHAALKDVPVAALFAQKSMALRLVQEAWYSYLTSLGVTGRRTADPQVPYSTKLDVPFEHPDVRSHIDSMFLDGTLHPLVVQGAPPTLPEWVRVGIIQDPSARRDLVADGIERMMVEMPAGDSTYRDWIHFARRQAEVIARFHELDASQARDLHDRLAALQHEANRRLREWVDRHYASLPSLPVARGPIMVHHVPRYLAMRRSDGEDKVALVVFDGLAIDQWVQLRESVLERSPRLAFDENACFAWIPTLTSISRQALFSGLRPREFAGSIETTARESNLWTTFWRDHDLRPNGVFYRKAIKRTEDLSELASQLSSPALKVAGLVVDTVDEIVHGAVLGKRGIATQIKSWCETDFANGLLDLLFREGFQVYLTSDHGNAEAVGIGRPKNEGVATEMRGHRVRTYRTEALVTQYAESMPETFTLDVAGLPPDFHPLFADGNGAFMAAGQYAVVHGGLSVEELMVPFVTVRTPDVL